MDALATLLIVLLVGFLVTVLALLVAAVLGARALGRRNRVSPATPSPAPLTWLGTPRAPARLHRRLRSAVTAARSAVAACPSAPRLAELTAELEQEALAVDAHLVVVASLAGAERRRRLAPLAQQVLRVEQIASQVSLLAVRAEAPLLAAGQASALDGLAHQLDLLEAARGEVAAVEAAAGVQRVSPYASGSTGSGPGSPSPGT